jgi:hypothetical protein
MTSVDNLLQALSESVGNTAAKQTLDRAMKAAGVEGLTELSQEQAQKVCEALKREGGLTKVVASTLILRIVWGRL